MSRSTANVSFYCRESKKNRDGLAPLFERSLLGHVRVLLAAAAEGLDIFPRSTRVRQVIQWNGWREDWNRYSSARQTGRMRAPFKRLRD